MSTYYAAQLGIALSVVDSKATYIQEEESRKKLLAAESSRQMRRRIVANWDFPKHYFMHSILVD